MKEKRHNILLLLLVIFPLTAISRNYSSVNIWEGTTISEDVEMTPFIAKGTGNTAIIICPGGSYFWHDMDTEGYAVAKWLQQNGISAFVLKYRTAGVPAFAYHTHLIVRGRQYPDAQNDLQRAIIYIKARADKYGIDVNKVGAMGFSAGGHLVMSVAERYDSPMSRPAFVAPIYPVVSMSHPCTHKRSRRALLGEYRKHNKTICDSLSLEQHVPTDCPPVFIVNCKDDPIVKYHNSVLLDSALTAKHVNHRYIYYNKGGHGFGASDVKGSPECRQWRKEFIRWIKETGF